MINANEKMTKARIEAVQARQFNDLRMVSTTTKSGEDNSILTAYTKAALNIGSGSDLPEPPAITPQLGSQIVTTIVQRLMSGTLTTSKQMNPKAMRQSGIAKIIGSTWDKEAWTAILIRLASRTQSTAEVGVAKLGVPDVVRNSLLSYVMQSYKDRIDFCIAWLTEEWYNDALSHRTMETSAYELWSMKVLENILPYLDSKDRFLIRFLSDLPALTSRMIDKLRDICVDPDRAQLGYTTLQYLIMLRPPVRIVCLDLVERLYNEDKSESVQQTKILGRWRPQVVVETSEAPA